MMRSSLEKETPALLFVSGVSIREKENRQHGRGESRARLTPVRAEDEKDPFEKASFFFFFCW